MDQAMIDITGTDAQVGDIVEIFGDHLPIAEIADKLGTISYEILTSISHRVQRVYINE
jgi:alanine racemase